MMGRPVSVQCEVLASLLNSGVFPKFPGLRANSIAVCLCVRVLAILVGTKI